jgi:cold shock CspA family protein
VRRGGKKETNMPIGKINKLVHLSQQTYQPNSKLIPGHNDKGYGTIDDEVGREVYFLHDAVPGIRGFDDLRRGQTVEYTLENGPYLRASSVSTRLESQPMLNPPKASVR